MLTRSYLNETVIQLLAKEINERLAYKVNKLALKLSGSIFIKFTS